MARRRGQFAHIGDPVMPMLAHKVGAGGRWSDFRPSGNGDGAAPAGACSLRGCESAMARRRGQFAYIGYPVMPMLAHKLARAVNETDFRPSRNGDGAEPAGACSLRGCESAMARRHGQFAYIGYPVTKMLAHTLARAVDDQIFDHPETMMGLRRLARAVCERVRARRRDGATARAVCLHWVSGHADACTHIGAGGRWSDFRPSRNSGGSVAAPAHTLRECR